jgi:hypothetical protein
MQRPSTVPSSTSKAANSVVTPVTEVVVGHGAGLARLERQPRLGGVERLDLGLLVDREHDRVLGRVDVQTDDVLELGGELGIRRALEGPDTMRL